MQNEPLFEPSHYPSTAMPASEEAAFLKTLGPVLREHKIDTKVLIYDHNWDRPDYPMAILKDPEASKYVDGVAWHGYGGKHEAMSQVHDAHPDKGVWFTESSGGDWVPSFHDAFMDETRHIIRSTRNWSKSVVWWNLALDKEHGPSLLGDWSTCRGLVTVDPATGTTEPTVDYYTMGHASKFVEPGAHRIESNTFENDVENVAFQNPDGSKVMVVSNRTSEPRQVRVKEGTQVFEYLLPGEAAATFKW
jgi:glucosylceramidase